MFAAVQVALGAVTWLGDLDLGTDATYAALKPAGESILQSQKRPS